MKEGNNEIKLPEWVEKTIQYLASVVLASVVGTLFYLANLVSIWLMPIVVAILSLIGMCMIVYELHNPMTEEDRQRMADIVRHEMRKEEKRAKFMESDDILQ